MKITKRIKEANKTLFSIEILPPKKGGSIGQIFEMLDPLVEMNPAFIDVTYHREEYVYKRRENGLLERQVVRKRPGTVAICAAIKNHYDIDTVPHIICGGFTKEETENALIELNFLGIDNIMVLRGDAVKSETSFRAEKGGHNYASDLLQQVIQLNKGIYLDTDLENSTRTDFCVGVAGYPEKHFEAPNLNTDLKFLKQKVDLGAEYIITQMFFDNDKYFEFVDKCRNVGIQCPIIPGIKAITSQKQLVNIPKFFHVDIPDDLVNEMMRTEDKQKHVEIGTEWCIAQSRELAEKGVPIIHFYTMSRNEIILNVLKNIL